MFVSFSVGVSLLINEIKFLSIRSVYTIRIE